MVTALAWSHLGVLFQDSVLVHTPPLIIFLWCGLGSGRFWCTWVMKWYGCCSGRPLHPGQLRQTLRSKMERPCKSVCNSFKVRRMIPVNVLFLWFKVHITKLPNLKTSVIDYNVRAEILSMGMGIDNSEHIEQLKKFYEGAKMPSFEESPSQTLWVDFSILFGRAVWKHDSQVLQ